MKTRTEIIHHLAAAIESATFGRVPASAIQPHDRLIADLKLDSLDYATVMLGCEQWSGRKLDENNVNWADIDTVEKLAGAFMTAAAT